MDKNEGMGKEEGKRMMEGEKKRGRGEEEGKKKEVYEEGNEEKTEKNRRGRRAERRGKDCEEIMLRHQQEKHN